MSLHVRRLLPFLFLLAAAFPASAQLERSLEAHGGLAKWRSFRALEYDLAWKSAKGEKRDHQLFDLERRAGLITSEKYTIGSDGREVWIRPGLEALGGIPPRFYFSTPFYFFAMPFVFADPGVKQEPLGKKSFRGREYDVIKFTYASGAGDTPDDYYIAYFEPATSRLHLAAYIVTYPSMRQGKPVTELEPHAILFEEWQTANGLLVPKVAPFYNWTGTDLEGEPLGRLEFSAVRFGKEAPAPEKFERPTDAVVAPL